MSKAGLDNRHRNKDDEISHKHGNTLIRMLRKYGQSFAAGYPETEKLSEVLLQLNEASLSQLRRDHETRHRSKRSHVRSGSDSDLGGATVRSALLPVTDINDRLVNVRFVPIPDFPLMR